MNLDALLKTPAVGETEAEETETALTLLASELPSSGLGDDALDGLLHTLSGGFGFLDIVQGLLAGLLRGVQPLGEVFQPPYGFVVVVGQAPTSMDWQSRKSLAMLSGLHDHSATTAICGIHPKGNPPLAAAVEIAHSIARILERRRSGGALKAT